MHSSILLLTYTGAAMGSLIQGIMPLVIVIPAAVFLKEKITAKVIAGILISDSGCDHGGLH